MLSAPQPPPLSADTCFVRTLGRVLREETQLGCFWIGNVSVVKPKEALAGMEQTESGLRGWQWGTGTGVGTFSEDRASE